MSRRMGMSATIATVFGQRREVHAHVQGEHQCRMTGHNKQQASREEASQPVSSCSGEIPQTHIAKLAGESQTCQHPHTG